MTRPTAPIISRPSQVPPAKRVIWASVTAVFWMAYLYLWIPLVTLFLWLLGLREARDELYLRQHTVDPFMLTTLPIIAVLAMIALVGWAEYNRRKFSGNDRRSRMDNIPLAQVASRLGAEWPVAHQLQDAKSIVLRMDPETAAPLSIEHVDRAQHAVQSTARLGSEPPLQHVQ